MVKLEKATERNASETKFELAVPKGMKDALPQEQILLNRILAALTTVFELHGFEPLDTPAVELLDILASKYAGGEEILKEIYTLGDRGGRELALRYDLTVPFARVFGMHKPSLPFKRYQIGKVWRDGPTGLARYREFIQCDVDTIGVSNMLADAECVSIASDVFHRFQIPVTIKVNNRKLLNGMVQEAGIPDNLASAAILAIDKLLKIGSDSVIAELRERGISEAAAHKFLTAANASGNNAEILRTLEAKQPNNAWREGVRELRELTEYAHLMGATDVQLDPSLARGLAYYTGTIFEVVARNSNVTASITGGGRYDKMVGAFLQDGKEYPAVGISFGLSRIFDVLAEREAAPASVVEVLIIPFAEQLKDALELVATLHKAGINADVEKIPRGLEASLKYANAKHIPFTVIIGADEAAQCRYKLRDMQSGDEELLDSKALVRRLTVE